jgi:hypothetical protein
MRTIIVVLLWLTSAIAVAQQNSFNKTLASFCAEALSKADSIAPARKQLLDNLAEEMTYKRYLMFTCKTNSRRTLLLQAWSQTAFIYMGLYNKFAISTGDTITEVYPEIANVLTASGFYCSKAVNGEEQGYLISVNKELPINIMLSKNYFGSIDTKHIVIANICGKNETSSIAATAKHFTLPYQSPLIYDGTAMEKIKYAELNKTIAIEMMYLAQQIKYNIANSFDWKR